MRRYSLPATGSPQSITPGIRKAAKQRTHSSRKPPVRIPSVFNRSPQAWQNRKIRQFGIKIIQSETFPPDKREHLTGKSLSLCPKKRNRNGRENRILFIRLAGTDDRNALPPAISVAICLRRRFRRQPDAARSASGKERPALFPPFVHRVRNRKRSSCPGAVYKLQTTRFSDSFPPAFGERPAPMQQSPGESPSRRSGLLRLLTGETPNLTTAIGFVRTFHRRTHYACLTSFTRQTTLYSICISYY